MDPIVGEWSISGLDIVFDLGGQSGSGFFDVTSKTKKVLKGKLFLDSNNNELLDVDDLALGKLSVKKSIFKSLPDGARGLVELSPDSGDFYLFYRGKDLGSGFIPSSSEFF